MIRQPEQVAAIARIGSSVGNHSRLAQFPDRQAKSVVNFLPVVQFPFLLHLPPHLGSVDFCVLEIGDPPGQVFHGSEQAGRSDVRIAEHILSVLAS
jgi:hypothetical protein